MSGTQAQQEAAAQAAVDAGRLPAAIQAQIDISYGAIAVSSYFSFLTMGVVLCCVWMYFHRYPKDSWVFKSLAFGLSFLCLIDSIAVGVWAFDWGVKGYGNPATMGIIHWGMKVDVACVGISSVLVQSFYAWRIWVISTRKNIVVPAVIMLCSLAAFAVVCWIVDIVRTHHLFTATALILPTVYVWLAGSILADLTITTCMIYYLDLRYRLRQEEVRQNVSTSRRLRQIIYRTVECNVLALIAQIGTIIVFNFQTQTGMYFVLSDVILPKVYTFSLLVSLLGRHSSGQENFSGQLSARSRTESHALPDRSARSKGGYPTHVSVNIQQETTLADDSAWMTKAKPPVAY